jgi:ABC-type transporter MlaC component
MKKIFFIIIFLIFELTQNSFAYSSDPKQFIQEIVDETKKILVDSNSKEFKTKKLSEIALKTVDIKGVAYYSLGNYRKELSDKQMEEYLDLFEKYFLK